MDIFLRFDVILTLVVILLGAFWAYAMLRLVIDAVLDAWRNRKAPHATDRAPAEDASVVPFDPFPYELNPTTGFPIEKGHIVDDGGYMYGQIPDRCGREPWSHRTDC